MTQQAVHAPLFWNYGFFAHILKHSWTKIFAVFGFSPLFVSFAFTAVLRGGVFIIWVVEVGPWGRRVYCFSIWRIFFLIGVTIRGRCQSFQG